jgi:hypothetical protein
MDRLDLFEVVPKPGLERLGKHPDPVLRALPVAEVMEAEEPLDPGAISVFRPAAVVAGMQCLMQPIQQLRFTADNE